MSANKDHLKIHVVSETSFLMKGQGVHTAFVDCVDLLKNVDNVEVIVNDEGWGDLMHAHTYGPYYFWKGRRYPGRRVYTVHVIPDSIKGSLPASNLFMPIVRWYFRKVYSYADICIAISPHVEAAIKDLNAATRVVRIFNPLPVDKFLPTPERRAAGRKLLGLPEDAFLVLGVGQIQGRKGVETFLEVSRACPDLNFVWVGGRPFGLMTEGIVRLNRLIAAAGKNVKFPGMFDLDKMPLIYNAADVFLFPSFQENCPLAPLEAAAAGLPVLFRDLKEYADLYQSPYLKAKDTAEFIQIIKQLTTDNAFQERGKQMSFQLLQQFETETIKQQLIELYREVLNSKNRNKRTIA
jgi:1,2-diacylglycerol-3-alpha-glucose alpha-1,2-galactosyltransferase